MNIKQILYVLVVLLSVFLIVFVILPNGFFCAAVHFHKETRIQPGENGRCSVKLRDYMEDQYGIYIPENAEFVDGYFDNDIVDPRVIVAFDVNVFDLEGYHGGMEEEELFLLLTHGVNYFHGGNYDSGTVKEKSEEFGRNYIRGLVYSKEPENDSSLGFSFLVCSDPNKDTVSFLFCGTHCGKSFK